MTPTSTHRRVDVQPFKTDLIFVSPSGTSVPIQVVPGLHGARPCVKLRRYGQTLISLCPSRVEQLVHDLQQFRRQPNELLRGSCWGLQNRTMQWGVQAQSAPRLMVTIDSQDGFRVSPTEAELFITALQAARSRAACLP